MAKAQGTRSRTQGRSHCESQGMAAVSPAPGHATSEAWPRAHHSGGTGRSPARSAAPLSSCRRRAWRDGTPKEWRGATPIEFLSRCAAVENENRIWLLALVWILGYRDREVKGLL